MSNSIGYSDGMYKVIVDLDSRIPRFAIKEKWGWRQIDIGDMSEGKQLWDFWDEAQKELTKEEQKGRADE